MTISSSENIFLRIRHRLSEIRYILLAFFIPVAIMMLAYASMKICPFGEKSVLILDLNGQYVYYFDYIHDVIEKGESLVYSWSRNLSGEFVGVIGYYLASPFNLLVWLMPRAMITEGLFAMIIAKFGACGAIFAFYAHKAKGLSKTTAVIFSPAYALCAYMVVQTMDPMWLDGVLILPLICYGVESLVKEYRFRMFIGSLIYAFVTNFYIGFMLAIFTVLYYLYYYFASAEYKKVGKTIIDFVKKSLFAGLCGITAAMSSCFMLLPVYNSLSNGKFEFTNPDYSVVSNFNIINVAQKLFPNTYDTVRMEGLPFIFCGSFAILFAALYFTCRRFRFSEKLSAGLLLGTLFICMYIRPVDMMWHGGQMPNWLPYRYSFVISFVLVSLAAQAFEHIKSIKARTIGIVSLLYIALIIYTESRDTFMTTLGSSGREVFDGITVALPAIAFMAVAGIAAYCIKKTKNIKNLSAPAAIVMAAVVLGEMAYNSICTLPKMNTDVTYSTKESYVDYMLPLREKVEEIKAQDNGFYRIEKNFFRTVNDPIAANMYGLSHSSSVLNARAIDMLKYFGFTSNGHYSRFSGNTPLTSDIFGVKYILNSKGNNTGSIVVKDDISVDFNDDALPIAYLTSNMISEYNVIEDAPFANQSGLLTAMLGRDEPVFCFKRFFPDEGPVANNCTIGYFEGNHTGFTSSKDGANVVYYLTASSDGEIYMYLPTAFQREVSVYVNGEYNSICFESDNHNIKDLGYFKEGEKIELKLNLNKSDLYFKEPYFMVYNEEITKSAISELNEMNKDTVVEKISGTHLKISVNADDNQLLFTTIPAEKGWEVFVDGQKTEYDTAVYNALMTVPLTKGQHTVELIFTPAGGVAGIIISIIGIAIFVIMIIIYMLIRRPVRLSFSKKRPEITTDDSSEITEDIIPEELTNNDIGG